MEELTKLIEEYKSIELARNHLVTLNSQIETELQTLNKLEAILNKEYDDVRKLEKLSLRGIFYKVWVKKSDIYELEKQEYLLAVLKYNEHHKIVELLKFEIEILEGKLAREEVTRKRLDVLIREREVSISKAYPSIQGVLKSMDEVLDKNYSYRRELHEALIVGAKAKKIFKQMIELLEQSIASDEDWGAYPAKMSNYSEAQNSYLDKAQQLSYRVKPLLEQLENEIEDIYEYKSIQQVNRFHEFRHFNDLYYERLISDWISHKRISSALNYLTLALCKVDLMVETLKIQEKTTTKDIEYLRNRKKEIIMKSVK